MSQTKLDRIQTDESTYRMSLAAPIERWDEAIPLGNGLMGGLLWGGGREVRLSLDRGDLWDLRKCPIVQEKDWTYAKMRRVVAEGNFAELCRMFDSPYMDYPYPTKIPGARLCLELPAGSAIGRFDLDMRRGVGSVDCDAGASECFFSAERPVAMMRVPSGTTATLIAPASLRKLDYAPAVAGRDGSACWLVQDAAEGFSFAILAQQRNVGGQSHIAIVITTSREEADVLAVARRRAAEALDIGYDRLLEGHVRWWQRFWTASSLCVSDAATQRHYNLVQYFYGSASRRGAPPIPLQGVWTADQGQLPPWKGDYHHDLNTQLTYWPYLAAGHFDEGASFIDFMHDLAPVHRRLAKEFFDAPGLAVPGVMSLDGTAMGGWAHYSLSPTNGAWVAHNIYLHWRYTMDRQFLADRAYPYARDVAEFLLAIMKSDASGKLKLPLSSSPEIHDNRLEAFLTPNSNFDLALIRWLLGALAEMAGELSLADQARRWNAALAQMDELAVEGSDGALRICPDESLSESHRHFSHLMAIHPLGTLNVEAAPRDRRIIDASLDQLRPLGTSQWCGYSFAWNACIQARALRAEEALRNLDIYLDGFISRNGFHVNADQSDKKYCDHKGRPFTLEGNFAAAQAVHEMVLQSWGGVVRVFPATPARWADVSFDRLRAEGGLVVSARRRGGKTTALRIEATCPCHLRLADPFDSPASCSTNNVRREGKLILADLAAGEVVEFGQG